MGMDEDTQQSDGRPLGFVLHNGSGELLFRQAGHPSNDPEPPWRPFYAEGGQPLLPAENVALTVALAQVDRGAELGPNTAMVCVLALARLAGRFDWTADPAAVDAG